MNKIDPQPVRHGNLYLSPAAILFAISGTLAKLILNGDISAHQLIQMRTTLVIAGLLVRSRVGHRNIGVFQERCFLKNEIVRSQAILACSSS